MRESGKDNAITISCNQSKSTRYHSMYWFCHTWQEIKKCNRWSERNK